MCSQGVVSHFMKNRRLQCTGTHEGLVGQASRPAPRAYLAAQEINFLRIDPSSRRGLGNKQPSLEKLPHLSHGTKKPEHLSLLASSASKGHSPDRKVCLYVVSKRDLPGDSAEGREHRWTFGGHMALLKNSPKVVTAWEAQTKRRTVELFSKARKQTGKAPNPVDTRKFLDQEVVVNTKNPSRESQSQKSPEDLRQDRLGGEGDTEELRQLRGLYRCSKHVAPLEETTFLQGTKIKPHSRHPVLLCPTSFREEGPGEESKPEPSGQDKVEDMKASKERDAEPQFLWENTFLEGQARVLDQNLWAEAKPQFLNRKKMQVLEMFAKSHDKEFCVVNTRGKIQLSFQDNKQGTSGRKIVRHKWQPRKEGWDPTIQGTPVVLAVRAHTYLPQGSKDRGKFLGGKCYNFDWNKLLHLGCTLVKVSHCTGEVFWEGNIQEGDFL
ncbi:Tex24 [Phodopus roborovskii]|uniref:Tex24 protein n=1 Tax=Phodopus roborovskii TaxID=109678 RepID=A0AAU9Z5I7_PHORO|nr:Tex24 [Phodopus roborovskii]